MGNWRCENCPYPWGCENCPYNDDDDEQSDEDT